MLWRTAVAGLALVLAACSTFDVDHWVNIEVPPSVATIRASVSSTPAPDPTLGSLSSPYSGIAWTSLPAASRSAR